MVEFARCMVNDAGEWEVDDEQASAVRADHVISAFGSVLEDAQAPHAFSSYTPLHLCHVVGAGRAERRAGTPA